MRQAMTRVQRMNGRGIKVLVAGRLNGSEIARSEGDKFGKIPLHTIRADIDYGQATAMTVYGSVGVKDWIYKGEVLPDRRLREIEAAREEQRDRRNDRGDRRPRRDDRGGDRGGDRPRRDDRAFGNTGAPTAAPAATEGGQA
jgi:small subunit ribosomal protein S3